MRGLWRTVSAVVIFGTTGAYAAHDAPPPIRVFDIPTIERLGHEMYEQDQLAWKATDILFTKHNKEELVANKERGWIVDSFPDHDVVRFVRETDLGPVHAYDVTFVSGQATGYSEPQSAPLSGEELAQYNARMTALKNVDRLCAETINTVALKDPQSDGWLVWAMAATANPKSIVIGGHYRFSISGDGKTVREKDALSRTCQNLAKEEGPDGELAQFVTTQVVSNIPVETFVFDTFSYRLTLRVGTPDGKTWKIDDGKITKIGMDMPGIDGAAARHLEAFNENCMLMATDAQHPESNPITRKIDSVIETTESDKNFTLKLLEGEVARAALCRRADFFLAPNDYKVLRAGLILYVADKGQGHSRRTGVLEINGGEFRFRQVEGDTATAEQQALISVRLKAFQDTFKSNK